MPVRNVFNFKRGADFGFSLIEITIAIAIIAVALVGILGLFPIALDAASDSQRETQAALIARTIYTDLDSRSDTKRLLLVSTDPIDSGSKPATQELDLTQPGSFYLAYDFDGLPLGKIDESVFSSGKKEAAYLAHIELKPQAAIPNGNDLTTKDMTRIEVSVQAPGSAPEESRKKYAFVSLYRQGSLLPVQPPTP